LREKFGGFEHYTGHAAYGVPEPYGNSRTDVQCNPVIRAGVTADGFGNRAVTQRAGG